MIDNSFEGERVLVTGASGVIGRALAQLLCEQGATVLGADRVPFPTSAPPSYQHCQLDLAYDDLGELREFSPTYIMHLAAAFERSVETPGFWPTNWADNTLDAHRIVDMAKDHPGLKAFVFASSYLVYDKSLYMSTEVLPHAVSLGEDSTKETRNLTGASKLYTEAEIDFMCLHHLTQTRPIHARIYRVYGQGSKDVVSRWVRAARAGEPCELYNPDNQFDYVYAGDVAEGLARLAVAPDARGPVNLATGSARPVRDVVSAISALYPAFARLIIDKGAIEACEASVADVGRLRELTGWSPQTTLEDGVRAVAGYEESRAVSGGGT